MTRARVDSRASALLGVISDTHGYLDPAVAREFRGVTLIIHAGDVGRESVLHELVALAPVVAVQGNMDPCFPGWRLPSVAWAEAGGARIYVRHRFDPDRDVLPEGAALVVAGHTHVPSVRSLPSGAVFVNPGSASRPRTSDGRSTVALVSFAEGAPSVRVVTLT